jgi:hypothetical protein
MLHSGHHILNRYIKKCFNIIEDSASHVLILDAATEWLHEHYQDLLTRSQEPIHLVA